MVQRASKLWMCSGLNLEEDRTFLRIKLICSSLGIMQKTDSDPQSCRITHFPIYFAALYLSRDFKALCSFNEIILVPELNVHQWPQLSHTWLWVLLCQAANSEHLFAPQDTLVPLETQFADLNWIMHTEIKW